MAAGFRRRAVPRAFDVLGFVARHGVVLASARGPVPSVAEAVAGEPVRGSWWAHAKGRQIFHALSELGDSADALCFRLVEGKVTFVHRRLWPALVRLSAHLGAQRLSAILQEHTPTGAHRNVIAPFPRWVTPGVRRAARALAEPEARAQLGTWVGKAAPVGDAKSPRERPRARSRARRR